MSKCDAFGDSSQHTARGCFAVTTLTPSLVACTGRRLVSVQPCGEIKQARAKCLTQNQNLPRGFRTVMSSLMMTVGSSGRTCRQLGCLLNQGESQMSNYPITRQFRWLVRQPEVKVEVEVHMMSPDQPGGYDEFELGIKTTRPWFNDGTSAWDTMHATRSRQPMDDRLSWMNRVVAGKCVLRRRRASPHRWDCRQTRVSKGKRGRKK